MIINKQLRTVMIVIFLVVLLLGGCTDSVINTPKTITIFAAASVKPAIDEISRKYTDRFGTEVEVTYGAGGEMLSKMIMARSGDIYMAPEQKIMETAIEKQAIISSSIKSVAYMIPVIAVAEGNPKHIVALADLARDGVKLVITRPETTLLGKYAPEIFERAGLKNLIEKNIVTYAPDPGSMLTMLISRQADVGITWHFYGVSARGKIEIRYLVPEQLTGVGEMQIGVSMYCKDVDSARKFMDYVVSDLGREVFKKYGYIVEKEEVKKLWKDFPY